MRHLLGIEQLSKEGLYQLLQNSVQFLEVSERAIKKVPTLRGKTVIHLFLEPSTRTLASFDIAGKRLSADTINISASSSSIVKGESLLDTAETLEAMAPDALVIRHRESGAPHFLARHLTKTGIINAGDGMHEHPTQALLDCLSLMEHFKNRSSGIEDLRLAIVGDVLHSRVARSNLWAHSLLGNTVHLIGPPTLVPREFESAFASGKIRVFSNLKQGIEGMDVVMCLRLQLERAANNFIPSLEEYTQEYFVSEALLQRFAPEAVVLHPGPVNRGVEVESALIDGPRSLMRYQVRSGVAVRMAVLFKLLTGGEGA